jgi:serine/threonine-protein kinase
LGSYQVTALLGEGGMGEVYRATDTTLGRLVAIKVLPESVASDPDRLARFEREAKTLAALNHPNIAAIYGLERSEGRTALVMELVEGPTLADRISTGPIPADEALGIARQIADALEAAHERGIVHRDLKPANVKVRADGTVKVLDFGLAKTVESAVTASPGTSLSPTITTPAMTQAGLILGTAAYMSPEQARGKTVDRRTDIWAFGCVVYEMLTGLRAFDAEDVSLTLSIVLQRDPDFSALPTRVPAHVAHTLRLCLRKDPRQRPSDIRDVRLALDGAFHVDSPAAVTRPDAAPAAHRRVPWFVAAASLLLAAFVGYGWWGATRPVERQLRRFQVDLGPEALRAPRDTLALSPDGARIVFVGRGTDAGTRQLFTRRLDEPAATPIASTTGGLGLTSPTFSPDGQWIAFISGSAIRRVSVQGGSSLGVAEVTANLTGLSWLDNDTIVFTTVTGMYRVPSSGGTPEQLKVAPGVKVFPYALPGARAVLMNSYNAAERASIDDLHVEVFNIETGETKTLVNVGYKPRYLPTSGSTGHLVFIRQGALFGVPFDPERLDIRGMPMPLLDQIGGTGRITGLTDSGGQFTSSNDGTFAYLPAETGTDTYLMSWLTASGQTMPLVAQPSTYVGPRISPDGSRLAYTAPSSKGGDVWVYDFQRATPTQLTFSGPGLREVAWAPDSRHLVYGDGQSLWWIRADGSGEPRKLLENVLNPRPFNFSSDGRLVFSPFGTQGLPDIWTMSVDLSDPENPKPGKAEPFLSEAIVEVDPSFSPDGKFLAYASTESGPNEVYVRAFPGPGKWKVSSTGGKFPAWSRTTRELFFLGGDNRIMVASYVIEGGGFVPGTPRPWSPTQVQRDGVRLNFDISPDGKRAVVFPMPTETRTEGSLHATFLLNFLDEVRRRIP